MLHKFVFFPSQQDYQSRMYHRHGDGNEERKQLRQQEWNFLDSLPCATCFHIENRKLNTKILLKLKMQN